MPCLQDWHEEAGSTKSEYFRQDLLVARKIFEAEPQRHVDIGSRVDGFVAHVASYREIEVFDVRPMTSQIPGIVFREVDLMKTMDTNSPKREYCDSLSCLHAIEHFGLGRYGDAVDPLGYERGIANMALLLKPGGRLYLSTPVGQERVEFNANWVFDPFRIKKCGEANALNLSEIRIINTRGEAKEVPLNTQSLQSLANEHYNLGLFIFIKK
jgi:hypothetical protein